MNVFTENINLFLRRLIGENKYEIGTEMNKSFVFLFLKKKILSILIEFLGELQLRRLKGNGI